MEAQRATLEEWKLLISMLRNPTTFLPFQKTATRQQIYAGSLSYVSAPLQQIRRWASSSVKGLKWFYGRNRMKTLKAAKNGFRGFAPLKLDFPGACSIRCFRMLFYENLVDPSPSI